jgi:hypothetical protein
MSPSDMISLRLQRLRNIELLRTSTVKPVIGSFRMAHYRGHHPGIAKLLLFDGNTAFADVYLDASGLLPLLVELIAEDYGGNGERADDKVENVAIHRSPFLFLPICQDLASRADRSSTPIGIDCVSNQENSTVNRVPLSLSPRLIRNSPPICSTKDRIIIIPSPLQAAGSNPSGKTWPSLETDSA